MPIQNNKSPQTYGGNSAAPFNDSGLKNGLVNNRPDISEKIFFWSVLGILVVAILVRILALLARNEFWTNEYFTMLVVLSPDGILHALFNIDTHPPLYYLLLKGWTNLFGIQEQAVRSLSILFGIAAVGVFPFWLRELGLERRAALWGMLLFALAGMQIQYSTEARSYMLGCLLVVLCLYCFTAAIRRQSPLLWIAFGIFLLLSFYTYPLLVPFTGAYLLAAWVLRVSLRGWVWFLAILVVDAVLYLPGFIMFLAQMRLSDNNLYLPPEIWNQDHLIINAIPESMLQLGLTGGYPDGLDNKYFSTVVFAASIGLLFLALIFVVEPTRLIINKLFKTPIDIATNRTAIRALWIFAFYNLVFLYLYSVLRRPMYLAGRYDIFAQPGYLALIGVGIAQFQQTLSAKSLLLARCVPISLVLLICIPCLRVAFTPLPFNAANYCNTIRGDLLARYAQPGDMVIATWPEAWSLQYEKYLHHLPIMILDFPSENGRHPGWINLADFTPEHLNVESLSIINSFNQSELSHHLWLVYDPDANQRNIPAIQDVSLPATVYAEKLFTAAADHGGLQRWQPGTNKNNFLDQLSIVAWKQKSSTK
jgi:Dolichyl-phosphate-mannose-protein mannosyltransferase